MNLKKIDILRLLKDNNINNYMYSDDIVQVNCPFCRSKSTGERMISTIWAYFVSQISIVA